MYQELNLEQRRVFVDTVQLFQPLDEARRAHHAHHGSMRWVTVKGRQYLQRRDGEGRRAHSIGPRSPDTESIFERFQVDKAAAEARYKALREQVAEQARYARAARINRVPVEVAGLCRLLANRDRWCIVGTNCLYAYEARAGVRITSGAEATQDADVLWNTRGVKHTALVSPALNSRGFLGLLKEIDKSFARVEREPFRAVNDRGFLVDLLRPFNAPEILDAEYRASELPEDLIAQPIRGLEWLVLSPKLREVVIDAPGFAVEMVVPDPRAFALHKLWLSERDDRDPVKRRRDREQALLVGRLLVTHLVDYPLRDDELRQFPADVRRTGLAELPPGL